MYVFPIWKLLKREVRKGLSSNLKNGVTSSCLSSRVTNLKNKVSGSTWTFSPSIFTPFSNFTRVHTCILLFSKHSKTFTLSSVFCIDWPISSATSQFVSSPSDAVKPDDSYRGSGWLGSKGLWWGTQLNMAAISMKSRFRRALVSSTCCLLVLGARPVKTPWHHTPGHSFACQTPTSIWLLL